MRKDKQDNSNVTQSAEGIIVSHLLQPTSHFEHPRDVLAATHLSVQEKRAILASWASDQYAVESIPALRHYPGSSAAVTLADVLTALRSLDGDSVDVAEPNQRGQSRRHMDLRALMPICRRHLIGSRKS